jgi:glutathione S-transferase
VSLRRQVRFALGEKGLAGRGHYLDLNPKAVVPTLVHDGRIIVESTVINEYLDEVFPAPSSRMTRRRAPR